MLTLTLTLTLTLAQPNIDQDSGRKSQKMSVRPRSQTEIRFT